MNAKGRTAVQLIGEDGNPLTMQCANYFGFNNGQTMCDPVQPSHAGSHDGICSLSSVISCAMQSESHTCVQAGWPIRW